MLLDAVSDVTGVPHVFSAGMGTDTLQLYPMGTRAKDVYVPDQAEYFLRVFGTPRRDVIKEREKSPTLAQALHMLNGQTIRDKLESANNIIGAELTTGSSDLEIIEEVYQRAYARSPNKKERIALKEFVASELRAGRGRRRALENILWAVLNSKEFLLNY